MIIDFHAHLFPTHFRSAGPSPASIFDVERLLEQQAEAGVDVSVATNSMIIVKDAARDLTALDALKEWNEFASDLTIKTQGRVVALSGTNPFGGPEFVREAERAVKEGGHKGFSVNSSVNGDYLDSPRAFPLYELACELDVPIFVHPPSQTIGADKMRDFRLIEMVGRPCDTTLSLARMILFGVLERYPNLKIVAAHMGGALMMLPGRLDYGFELREDMSFGPWGPNHLSKPPSAYINQIYVDSMGFHAPGVLCAINTIGVDHVLLGSDCPPVNIPLKRSVDLVRNLPIAKRDREKILGGNAARLLKME